MASLEEFLKQGQAAQEAVDSEIAKAKREPGLLLQALGKLEMAAAKCELWAHDSRTGGWSTHQVDANLKLASELRVFVAAARRKQGAA